MARSLLSVGRLLTVASFIFLSGLPVTSRPSPQDGPATALPFSYPLWLPGCRLSRDAQRSLNLNQSPQPLGGQPAKVRELSRAIEEIARRVEEEPTPGALHALGVLRLVEHRYQEALLTLESVSLQPGVDASSLSDLAAAYLARGKAENRSFDSILALAAADRALALQPDLQEALFNRAESLTRLHLVRRAFAAWRDYFRLDPDSSWAQEADGRLRTLAEPTLDALWERERLRLDAALARQDLGAIRAIVSSFPHRSRLYGEEGMLTAWAQDSSPFSTDRLAAAHRLGAAIQERTRDAMLTDSVSAIERARDSGDRSRLAALRRGHLSLSQGLAFYRVPDFRRALPLLRTARDHLKAGNSPFAAWADFYIAVCELYASSERGLQSFEQLRRRYDDSRYPGLTARIEWMLGTTENNRGQAEKALTHYQKAFELLDGSVGPQASGFVHILLAEAYQGLGQPDRAWEERLTGIEANRRLGDRRQIQAALNEAAERLLNQGFPGPALEFAEELLINAGRFGKPAALAEANLQKGRALAALGRAGEALQVLQIAGRYAASLPGDSANERLRSTFELVEGNYLVERDPRKAVELLSRSLATRLGQNYQYHLLHLLTSRARAYLELGDPGRAESDLRLAIEGQERIRAGVKDPDFRLSSFEQAQSAFDEMIRLQVDRFGSSAKAFEFAERARSRLLLDQVAGGKIIAPAMFSALTAPDVLNHLPEEVTLVEYLVLPERLLAWVIRPHQIRLVQTKIPESEINRLVRLLRTTIERRASPGEIQSAASRLYNVLVRPFAGELSAGGDLVLVPDRSLVQVPFAALFDAGRKRYFVEDHSLTVAPSAAVYLASRDRLALSGPGAPRDLLAIGDPSFDRQLHPRLGRLPAAADEAAGIAALYGSSDLLQGEAATRSAFLASAPGHRIVHFAGHGLLDPVSPGLSMLLFAPGGEKSGALYARDLAGYRLEGTRIVVLSACRTLDGVAASRESLVGLAAAFLAAGPPVVVSSLWKVDDRATRELMLAFHAVLRQGAVPATALQSAQLRLLRGPEDRFRSPAFWAGFETFGAGNLPSRPSPSTEAAALQGPS